MPTRRSGIGAHRPYCRLICGELTAPWVTDKVIGRAAFDAGLKPNSQRCRPATWSFPATSPSIGALKAAECLKQGSWSVLPRYSPDLNSIEMTFAKLKPHLRVGESEALIAL